MEKYIDKSKYRQVIICKMYLMKKWECGGQKSGNYGIRPFKIECVFCIRKFWKLNA